MTSWLTCERTATAHTTDGKYEVRPLEGAHALYQKGLARPLLIGPADDCRALAEMLESDAPLSELPPLRLRSTKRMSKQEQKLLRLSTLVARSGSRLAFLRGAAAPDELVTLELGLLRRLSCKLMRAAYETPEPS